MSRPVGPEARSAREGEEGSASSVAAPVRLRELFRGRRGRLLAGLLVAETAVAVQLVTASAVLPLAAADLDGRELYGAALAINPLGLLAVLVAAPRVLARLGARRALLAATAGYLVGMALTAGAPAMEVLLVGSLVRGLSAGLLAGFGMSALGGLFEDAVRPRVVGLFAVAWVMPSLLGPAVAAALASTAGWRAAVAVPVLPVVVARLLVARDADLVVVGSRDARVDVLGGAVLVAALAATSAAPAVPGAGAAVMSGLGAAVALVAAVRLLRGLVGAAADGRGVRLGLSLALLGVSAAFFGLQGLVVVAVLDVLGAGVVASSTALGAGLLGWAVTGLRPPSGGRVGPWDAARAGASGVVAGCGLLLAAVALPLPSEAGVVLAVGAFALAGVGMGMAYPQLSSRPFDGGLPVAAVPAVAAALVLAELVGTAVGALAGGGTYSTGTAAGWDAAGAVTVAAAVLLGVAAATWVLLVRAVPRV